MPPSTVNVVLSTGAIVVVTVVAGIAIAVYESPEVRRVAEDCRRRIAVALHSLGDEINPRQSRSQQPRFNRPEDADGFLRSTAEAGVDADEASRRRQREELMYWNQIHLEKLEREKKQKAEEERKNSGSPGGFGDYLQEDKAAEEGTYVFNTGADIHGTTDEGLTHRRSQGVRGLDRGSAFANPFADENHIEMEEQHAMDASLIAPEGSEISEDIYGADDIKPHRETTETLSNASALVDVSESVIDAPPAVPAHMTSSALEDSYMTAGQENPENAYASIQAWADQSQHSNNFYSPLPVTPQAPLSVISEPELLDNESDGQATPTDSTSVAGSGEDVGRDNGSSVGEDGRYYDVMSEDGEGVSTPGSWTEVGSVVSENDAGHRHP